MFTTFIVKNSDNLLFSQENSTSPQRVSPSPQKPIRTFLKKGQGLARFKMRPPHPKKHKTSKRSISPANKTGQGRMVIEKQEERPSQTQPAVQIKVACIIQCIYNIII